MQRAPTLLAIGAVVLFLGGLAAAVLHEPAADDPAALTTTSSTAVAQSSRAEPTTTTVVSGEGVTDLVATGLVPPIGADGPVRAVVQDGVTLPVMGPRTAAGWPVLTPCGRDAVAGGTPLRGAHVVLDAGHGGDESGAEGPAGTREADLNLGVTVAVRDRLAARGLVVATTRDADLRVTLGTRARLATALEPMAFVSIHHNADPDGPRPGPGSEAYFQIADPESRRLTGLVTEEVVSTLRSFDVAWVGDTDAGAKFRRNSRGGDYYAVLRQSAGVPSSLVEVGFVSNPAEEALYQRPEVRDAVADAVTAGIVRFLITDDPGSMFTDPYPRSTPAGGGGGPQGCVDPPLVAPD